MGITFGNGTDYPYPNEPQYQYPDPLNDARGKALRKCPQGQALYKGRCRIKVRVY